MHLGARRGSGYSCRDCGAKNDYDYDYETCPPAVWRDENEQAGGGTYWRRARTMSSRPIAEITMFPLHMAGTVGKRPLSAAI